MLWEAPQVKKSHADFHPNIQMLYQNDSRGNLLTFLHPQSERIVFLSSFCTLGLLNKTHSMSLPPFPGDRGPGNRLHVKKIN